MRGLKGLSLKPVKRTLRIRPKATALGSGFRASVSLFRHILLLLITARERLRTGVQTSENNRQIGWRKAKRSLAGR